MTNEEKHRMRLQELEALDDKRCKLNSKSSSIKFELPEPSTRKSMSGLSRKVTLS